MREIKFRIYSEIRNMMLYSDEAPTLSQFFMGKELAEELGQPIVLMQYTGLKDKNGKEIYEGDIIDYGSGRYYPITYKVNGFGIQFNNGHERCWLDLTKFKVIGNMYENSEILKHETSPS